jgi:diguanylate cyclase (GGDEF)-like protein
MAGLGERPLDPINGASGQPKDLSPLAPEQPEGDHGRADRVEAEAEAEADQTRTDSNQTAADWDQTASDSDQAASDSDQAASDRDQAASDRILVQGGDLRVHDLTRDMRGRGAQQRHESTKSRVEAAAARDAIAHARDLMASERDQAAERRDRQLAARDVAWAEDGHPVPGEDMALHAAEIRRRSAANRASAAEGRARAAADREQAARDRDQAARDRLQAQADRDALLYQLAIAETDALTGTRTRGAGLADLDHELDRARRTTAQLVVAYVDVVGLKAVNDEHGHAAGDALLQRVVREIRNRLRSYDLIIRLGGDEFLCVMSDTTMEGARQRFNAIQAGLETRRDRAAIKIGLAAFAPEDSAAELIERADAELPTTRAR